MKIIPLIDKGATLLEDEKEPVIGVYYISTLNRCLRQNYYSYFEKPHYSFKTQKLFAIGNALHGLVQSILIQYAGKHKELGFTVENEVSKLYYKDPMTGLEIHGRLDCFLIDKEGNEHVIEIKTIKNLKYAPVKEHFEQLNYYLYPKHPIYKTDNIFGHFLYINKANQIGDEEYVEFKEIPKTEKPEEQIHFDKELFNCSIVRARIQHHYIKNRILPFPEAKMDSDRYWQCASCPFRQKCDAEENGKVIGTKLYKSLTEKYA